MKGGMGRQFAEAMTRRRAKHDTCTVLCKFLYSEYMYRKYYPDGKSWCSESLDDPSIVHIPLSFESLRVVRLRLLVGTRLVHLGLDQIRE